MDPLRKDDIESARRTPEGERFRQAIEVMALGIALKRARLREADQDATEELIEARLGAWLAEPR